MTMTARRRQHAALPVPVRRPALARGTQQGISDEGDGMTVKELYERLGDLLVEHGDEDIVAWVHTDRPWRHPLTRVRPDEAAAHVVVYVDTTTEWAG